MRHVILCSDQSVAVDHLVRFKYKFDIIRSLEVVTMSIQHVNLYSASGYNVSVILYSSRII